MTPQGTAAFPRGWERFQMEVTRQEAMAGVRPPLPGTGKQWSRDLGRGCGPEEAAVGPR